MATGGIAFWPDLARPGRRIGASRRRRGSHGFSVGLQPGGIGDSGTTAVASAPHLLLPGVARWSGRRDRAIVRIESIGVSRCAMDRHRGDAAFGFDGFQRTWPHWQFALCETIHARGVLLTGFDRGCVAGIGWRSALVQVTE